MAGTTRATVADLNEAARKTSICHGELSGHIGELTSAEGEFASALGGDTGTAAGRAIEDSIKSATNLNKYLDTVMQQLRVMGSTYDATSQEAATQIGRNAAVSADESGKYMASAGSANGSVNLNF